MVRGCLLSKTYRFPSYWLHLAFISFLKVYSRIIVPCIARQPSCWQRWFIIGIALFMVREVEKGRSRTGLCKLPLIPGTEKAFSSNAICRIGHPSRPQESDPCLATCTHWPAVLGVQGDWWGVISCNTVAKTIHRMCRNQKVQVMKTLYMKLIGKEVCLTLPWDSNFFLPI